MAVWGSDTKRVYADAKTVSWFASVVGMVTVMVLSSVRRRRRRKFAASPHSIVADGTLRYLAILAWAASLSPQLKPLTVSEAVTVLVAASAV